MSKKIVIIGSGFSSLTAACYLAQAGFEVTVLEKNDTLGGRASQLKKDGFLFDMGPSFYWMPDVFEKFFGDFNTSVSDFYFLEQLNPAYTVYFGEGNTIKIGDSIDSIAQTFETIEPGAGKKLKKFLQQAQANYKLAIEDLVYQPGETVWEIITPKSAAKLDLFFKNMKSEAQKRFKDPRLQQIIEFPVLFLGAKPQDTPAFYNFMNYADMGLGTWHPKGGMYAVVQAFEKLALSLGVQCITHAEVKAFSFEGNKITEVHTSKKSYPADVVLSGADYVHTESLLPEHFKMYKASYWEKKTFAPSALLFYVGFNEKLKGVSHHSLFFDADFEQHAKEIYTNPAWPKNPLFYASFPSLTDDAFAPTGQEAAVFLMPLAPGLQDDAHQRKKYFDIILNRLELHTQQSLKEKVLFYESFAMDDFVSRYHSYKGNAYGLANTLLQTHYFRPKLKSKKVKNLYFCGQLTVPGPGVPPSIISGNIVSKLIRKYHEKSI